MTLQIELLETSFQAITPCGEEFVTAFYERLFTRFPQTRAFFASTDMKEQRKKLLGALALVIQNLRKPEVLTSALTGLGQRHGSTARGDQSGSGSHAGTRDALGAS